jgi:hypothetical protein
MERMAPDVYVVAGVDLRSFVGRWVADLEAGGGRMRGLLDACHAAGTSQEEYFYGAMFLMANIAPRAAEPTATVEEVLLFGVLALHQEKEVPSEQLRWDTLDGHVLRAFEHLRDLGPSAAALELAHLVLDEMRPAPPEWAAVRRQDAALDPARSAAHDRDMAYLAQRELRAAALLDPDLDFDRLLLDRGADPA